MPYNWNLIKEFVITDFKLRYNRSVLGFFWSLIKPLLMLGTLYIVFSIFFNLNIPNYQLFLLLGLVVWTFFVEATVLGTQSLVSKGVLIKKINFPKAAVVLSSNLTCLVTFFLNLLVFSFFFVIARKGIGVYSFLFIFFIFELFLLSLGISYLLSALYVKYRDMIHIWDVLIQVGFWITPIVYPLSFIPENILKFYMLNPIARIINDSRDVILNNTLPSFWHLMMTLIICTLVYLLGITIFKKRSREFAEQL
ncbi:ABC transporter permease [Candidatus Pacearchaeota archaeon]|nr:ABC transporter permease [Candidatus Pacearchaeota archaeon]